MTLRAKWDFCDAKGRWNYDRDGQFDLVSHTNSPFTVSNATRSPHRSTVFPRKFGRARCTDSHLQDSSLTRCFFDAAAAASPAPAPLMGKKISIQSNQNALEVPRGAAEWGRRLNIYIYSASLHRLLHHAWGTRPNRWLMQFRPDWLQNSTYDCSSSAGVLLEIGELWTISPTLHPSYVMIGPLLSHQWGGRDLRRWCSQLYASWIFLSLVFQCDCCK